MIVTREENDHIALLAVAAVAVVVSVAREVGCW